MGFPFRRARQPRRRTIPTAAVVLGTFAVAACFPACAEDLGQTARELQAVYAEQLSELAAWCDSEGLTDQARQTRIWLRPRDPGKLYVTKLPEAVGPPPLPEGTAANVAEWDAKFTRLKRDQANSLHSLARRAIRGNQSSLAFDLVLAAVRENPDHEAIRRLLGHQPHAGKWRSLYEVRKLRAGQVWHERFGWLPKSHVHRYEQGQRYRDGRWMSVEEESRISSVNWDVSTEHYTILTNHSLEAGVELGMKLERLYRVWKQLFVRYFATEAQVIALFDGRGRGQIQLPRHTVVYFRDRDFYNRFLKPTFPNIEISEGVYHAGKAYFFASEGRDSDSEERDRINLFHEATHQLFHESRPVAPNVGKDRNYWIIEGIAMYMETLREENGYHVLGGFDNLRMQAARYRLLQQNFYIPLEDFASHGMDYFQNGEELPRLYSQAAALTTFLIHYDNGRYRDALVAYLTAVYTGQDLPNTLVRLTGTSYEELDQQYRQFMRRGSPLTVSPHGGHSETDEVTVNQQRR